jgi:hypothetical protein
MTIGLSMANLAVRNPNDGKKQVSGNGLTFGAL